MGSSKSGCPSRPRPASSRQIRMPNLVCAAPLRWCYRSTSARRRSHKREGQMNVSETVLDLFDNQTNTPEAHVCRFSSTNKLMPMTPNYAMRTNALECPTFMAGDPLAGAGRGRSQQPAGGDLPFDAGADAAERIEQCIAFMREHLNQPLQVATLAAKAC